jgi:hypothetical protein
MNNREEKMSRNSNKAVFAVILTTAVGGWTQLACAWDSYGHMAVACVAYQQLTPQSQQRVNDLVKLNPEYQKWLSWTPGGTSQSDKDMMVFMLAATWPDEIKTNKSFTADGSDHGDRPEGSPNPGANKGYGDMLMHKYWHFVDTPFTRDGTALPPLPAPNAQERIALFRAVLSSTNDDQLKSYDLVWLLHLVGDVHQPLHCATRVSNTDTNGDAGGNGVKLSCTGCPPNLHAFWDDLLGSGESSQVLPAVVTAAKRLPAPDPALAAKSDEKNWVAESFQAAQANVYQPPVGTGDGPFSLSSSYEKNAKTLAAERIALAGARLANLINHELK